MLCRSNHNNLTHDVLSLILNFSLDKNPAHVTNIKNALR